MFIAAFCCVFEQNLPEDRILPQQKLSGQGDLTLPFAASNFSEFAFFKQHVGGLDHQF